MNNFQTILVAIFLAAFVFGVLIFSGALKITDTKKSSSITGKIVVWGTFPMENVGELFGGLSSNDGTYTVSYVEKNKETFTQELIESIAKDSGPDLFVLPTDLVLSNSNFAYKIPYSNLSERTFRDLYIDGADILLFKEGVVGYPLIVDPIVMYYNKNILSNESIVFPPTYWDEMFSLSSKIIKKKNDGQIDRAMIALGQYDNVNHAKDILSALLLQTGNKIIDKSKIENQYHRVAIKDVSVDGSSVANLIIDFFLEFSNPSKEAYTWNRSLPNSLDMFTNDKLAFYLGYGSELFGIQSLNPNLSFDVVTLPQVKGTNIKATYGNIYTLMINKKSKNLASSFGVANLINGNDFVKNLGISLSLPTANRSLLNEKPEDLYLSTFFDSAIITKTWLDPDTQKSDLVFKELIQNSLSNKLSTSEAIEKASNQLEILLEKIYE